MQNFQGIIASVVLGACLFASPVHAQEAAQATKSKQHIQYDVYAGGIHALKSNLNIVLTDKERYDVDLTAKTYGLLGKMAPWEGKFESHGWSTKAGMKPEVHQATTTWRGDEEIKKYSYNKDGSFKSYVITDDENDGKVKKVAAELTQNTSDVLTATLNVMQSMATNSKCEGSEEVFDGKRRFKMIFKEKKAVKLEDSRWNAYAGDAVECTVEVKPVAGKWHEKPRGWMSIQEQGRDQGTMPTVWFANIKEGEPAVPVKVRVKTSYGTLFMHMTKYTAQGKSLKIEK